MPRSARATPKRALVQGEGGTPAAFGLLKLIATTASSISGIPGGIFAPSLACRRRAGREPRLAAAGRPAQVLGMVGYASGVVQAPITAFAIVAEMTNDHALVVPLMLTSLIGLATSQLLCPEGVYHALSRNFLAVGEAGHVEARTAPISSA